MSIHTAARRVEWAAWAGWTCKERRRSLLPDARRLAKEDKDPRRETGGGFSFRETGYGPQGGGLPTACVTHQKPAKPRSIPCISDRTGRMCRAHRACSRHSLLHAGGAALSGIPSCARPAPIGRCRITRSRSSTPISSAAGWRKVSCACAASIAMPKSWWRSAVRSAASVHPALRGAWPRLRYFWPMRCCPSDH